MADHQIELELEKTEPGGLYATQLSEANRRYAEAFAAKIDVTDTAMIMQYGAAARQKVIHFSESSLLDVPHSDLQEAAKDIRKLIRQKETFTGNVRRICSAGPLPYADFRKIYDPFSAVMTETGRRLEIHRGSLIRHSRRMERFYEQCMDTIREFDLYIYAGKCCLKNEEQGRYADLVKRAQQTDLLEDTMRAQDYRELLARLERKLEDLKVSRALPMQTMTQIRLISAADLSMAETLEKLYTDAFPLYRNTILLSYGIRSAGSPAEPTIDLQIFLQAETALDRSLQAVLKLEENGNEARRKGISLAGWISQ